jgi:hypothetical protein
VAQVGRQRVCPRCKKQRRLGDYPKVKIGRGWFDPYDQVTRNSWCIWCKREAQREYRSKCREKQRETFKQWHERNREELNRKRRERYRTDPEYRQRRLDTEKRKREKRKHDRKAMEKQREYQRLWYHARREQQGHGPPKPRKVFTGDEPVQRLPIAPFRAWLQKLYAEFEDWGMVAEVTGISERQLLRYRGENEWVELEIADRALTSEGSMLLWDLWPELAE